MLGQIYSRVLKVLMQKPLKLWGISWLSIFLTGVLSSLCGVAIPVLGISVGVLISVATALIYLRGLRGEEIAVLQLFELFKNRETIKRVLLGMGWMTLWIVLWALIPIVGPVFALIRVYEYRLVPYILVFNPEVPVTEALKVSKEKTMGYKLYMWLADFVYIIVVIVAMILLAIFATIPVIGFIFTLAFVILYFAFILALPILPGLIQAAVYDELTKNM